MEFPPVFAWCAVAEVLEGESRVGVHWHGVPGGTVVNGPVGGLSVCVVVCVLCLYSVKRLRGNKMSCNPS